MAGPHIFAFPAVLRKAKATPARPTPQTPVQGSVQPLVNGRAEQSQNGSHTSPWAQGNQGEYSHMGISQDLALKTISVSDMSTESGTLVAAGDKELGHVPSAVRPKASSQQLGSQKYEVSCNPEGMVDETDRSLRGHPSSSTLRSFYDPQNIPLAVSQQTSNSSARDLALRKGCPPVVSTEKLVSRPLHSPETLDAITLESPKKARSFRLDLSTLFPKPSAHQDPFLSSRLGERCADAVRDPLSMPPVVPLGPSTTQKHQIDIANASKAPSHLRQSKEPTRIPCNPEFTKINIRKPKSGIKHWFDHLQDEDLEDIDQHENAEFQPPTKFSRYVQSPAEPMPAELDVPDRNPDRTSLYHRVCDVETGSNQPHLQMPSERKTTSPAREPLRLARQNQEFKSKHRGRSPGQNQTTDFRKIRGNPFNTVDLRKASVLWLSSSDDESEADDSPQSDISTTIPGIRDSLSVGRSDSSDVEIGTAHAIKTKRLKLEKESPGRKSPNQVTHISESSVKTVRVPERQSSRIFSFLSDQSRSMPSTREPSLMISPTTATSSDLVGQYLHSSTTGSRKHDRHPRLMTVTAQEELLLEAIRSGRTGMRQKNIGEPFRRTSDGESSNAPRRPQTSRFEGNSATFLRLSQDSVATLSAFRNHRRSLSAGEILDFSNTEHRKSYSTDQITSRRDSLAYSSLPSSSSQESPPTPTSESVQENSNRKSSTSTQRYSPLQTNYQRHSRVRTGSSGIIVLDNIDDDSSSQLKQDEWPIWALNGWADRPGLAVVH